jgi:ATP-dependent Clp protease ATP-binding subunit ClpA
LRPRWPQPGACLLALADAPMAWGCGAFSSRTMGRCWHLWPFWLVGWMTCSQVPASPCLAHARAAVAGREVAVEVFERFTDRARRVVVLAQEEARMLSHNYLGTEHLLLGLVHEGEGVAARALESLGISLQVRQQVEEIIGQGQQPPAGHIPFTPRAKKVMELAQREANDLGHNYVGTEHLLLGLVREGEGVAAQVLVKLGADLAGVRQQVVHLLHGPAGSAAPGQGRRRGKRARARLMDAALPRIEALDQRLAAVERWVGMRPDLDDVDQQIAQVRRQKEAAIDAQDFKTAAAQRDQEKRLLTARASQEKEWAAATGDRASLAAEFGRSTLSCSGCRPFCASTALKQVTAAHSP